MLEFALVPLIAFAAGLGVEPRAPVPVVGGTDASVCDFPSDVWIGSAGGFNCTASLVHPRVLITAAHCLGSISMAGFGESAFNSSLTVGVANCSQHPDYNFGGPDIAFCVLSEDAPDVDVVPVLMGCEAEELTPGREIVIAGFGQSDEASGSGGGIKRFTSNTIDSIHPSNGEIYLLGNNTGSCFGDSGGPSYIQLADGTWRVVAAVQGPHPNAPQLGCGFGGTYTLVHPFMEWIESASGFDITPCFDADGTWNPDETCGSFPTQLQGFGGQWSNLCVGAPVSGAGESCGPANGGIDPDPTGGGDSDTDGGTDTDAGGETGTLPPDGPMDDGSSTSGGDEPPTGDTSDTGDDESAADDEDDDDDDAGQDEEADPALPGNYGFNNASTGCSVGPGPGRFGALLFGLLGFGGLVRRRRVREHRI